MPALPVTTILTALSPDAIHAAATDLFAPVSFDDTNDEGDENDEGNEANEGS